MSRVLNTVVEQIRLEDKLELLHIELYFTTNLFRITRRVLPHSSGEFKFVSYDKTSLATLIR